MSEIGLDAGQQPFRNNLDPMVIEESSDDYQLEEEREDDIESDNIQEQSVSFELSEDREMGNESNFTFNRQKIN